LAYKTLTERAKYENWRTYGHPDGALAIKVVELMLPEMLMDRAMMPMWLTAGFIALVASVLALLTW
jgi:preprotein translocase subunit Sec63